MGPVNSARDQLESTEMREMLKKRSVKCWMPDVDVYPNVHPNVQLVGCLIDLMQVKTSVLIQKEF